MKVCRPVIFRINMTILILLTICSIWINIWTTGRAFRGKKYKQALYNMA